MFNHILHLNEIIGIENLDVSNVTDMACMFYKCKNLKKLDLSKWNVSKCIDFNEMFFGCNKLKTTGDLSNWKIHKEADLQYMFAYTTNLSDIGPIETKWILHDTNQISNMFIKSNLQINFKNIKN